MPFVNSVCTVGYCVNLSSSHCLWKNLWFTDALEFGGVHAVVYSPDETMIAAGGSNDSEDIVGSIKIWNASTGKLVINLEPTREVPVSCLAWPGTERRLFRGQTIAKLGYGSRLRF
jgi:WD40 repeat protein